MRLTAAVIAAHRHLFDELPQPPQRQPARLDTRKTELALGPNVDLLGSGPPHERASLRSAPQRASKLVYVVEAKGLSRGHARFGHQYSRKYSKRSGLPISMMFRGNHGLMAHETRSINIC